MIKKEIYPKTKRIKVDGFKVQLTEKLDGSNLVLFKKDDKLHIAQSLLLLLIIDNFPL